MNIKSIALSFRAEANFHALNNEGSGGTNVMEPRRIVIGDKEYDGVSGEMARRHILENFVRLCQANGVALHNRCAGLVPDRGLQKLVEIIQNKNWKTKSGKKEVPGLAPEHYSEATKEMVAQCALCDIGGYLFPLSERNQNLKGTLKRDSCFEVGWLISEHPAIADYTQHAAYHETQEHNLFVQNIRSGIYAGVIRIDLYRIGYNDWWWVNGGRRPRRYAVNTSKRTQRAELLLEAIEQYLLSLGGAKTAGWLQHPSGLLEGVVVTSTSGLAPFVSPIKLEFSSGAPSIERNPNYVQVLKDLKDKKDGIGLHEFKTMADFAGQMKTLRESLNSTKEKAGRGDHARTQRKKAEE